MTQPGLYRHYKGGLYRVLHVATDSTNGSEGRHVVVYISLTTGCIHVRDALQFIEVIDGVRRFDPVVQP